MEECGMVSMHAQLFNPAMQSVKELKKNIKQTLSSLYCIFGEEDYLKEHSHHLWQRLFH